MAQVASAGGAPQAGAAAPTAPIDPELNAMLRQIEQLASSINLEIGKLRVDKWKADSASKRQAEGNIDSVQRESDGGAPGIHHGGANSPRNVAPEFRLYRNLNALSDVLNSIAESAGAFGPKDQFERLAADINGLEAARTALGKRVESLAEAQALELAQLRKQLLQARAQQSAPAKPSWTTTPRRPSRNPLPARSQNQPPDHLNRKSQPQQSQPQSNPVAAVPTEVVKARFRWLNFLPPFAAASLEPTGGE